MEKVPAAPEVTVENTPTAPEVAVETAPPTADVAVLTAPPTSEVIESMMLPTSCADAPRERRATTGRIWKRMMRVMIVVLSRIEEWSW